MKSNSLILHEKKRGIHTEPDDVTAAKTVEEYGAHATSPTELPKSNVKIGSLYKQTNIR